MKKIETESPERYNMKSSDVEVLFTILFLLNFINIKIVTKEQT